MNKNYQKNILTVVAWDFAKNMEYSCYQMKPELDAKIG